MKKILFLILCLFMTKNVLAASMSMIGEKGDPNNVDRTIKVKM